ncbi:MULTISPECIES: hypothetical protein [unclassified Microcoleus]|uniref:hypothetical protein n=1 Tax=unclassified Microcoleus TaxID=2642155 RepID=UPI002FD3D66A
MPVPQENQYLCGTGILPVAENGAISQFQFPIPNSQFPIPNYPLPIDCYNLVNSAKGSKWQWQWLPFYQKMFL